MRDFAQFMAGVTIAPGLDVQPDKGQAWRFADGRQGIVAAVDVSGATVYVGPESFRVPRGDWAVVFGAAGLVLPPAVAPAPDASTNVATPVDSPAVILGSGEHSPPAPAPAPAQPAPAPAPVSDVDKPAFPHGFGEPPGGPSAVSVVEPATPSAGKSGRNRKR